MPSELEANVRAALEKLAKALADASELEVKTYYKILDPDPAKKNDTTDPNLAAQTKIELDGDQTAIVPVTRTPTGTLVLHDALLDFHLRNVQSAITYRAGILNALLDLTRGRGV